MHYQTDGYGRDEADQPAPACETCGRHGHEPDDCLLRDEPCDLCGTICQRDRMFWQGDNLIGDCCET